jgi:hypothetical protein
MRGVRFDIEPPRHGWALVRLTAPGNSFECDASFTPRDSITDLARAISSLLAGETSCVVVWNTEPEAFDFNFQASRDSLRLEISEYPNYSRRRKDGGTPIATVESQMTTFVEAIWRGLRRLEGKVSNDEFAAAWHHDFPAAIVHRIGTELRARRTAKQD